MQRLITSYYYSPASSSSRLLPSASQSLPRSNRAAAQQPPATGKIAQSVHSLNEQPNVILDLIFSYLWFYELEGAVFPVSRRLAAHLRRRSVAFHDDRRLLLRDVQLFDKFFFVLRLWKLCSFCLEFRFGSGYSCPWAECVSDRMRGVNMSQECPNLEKAKLTITIFTDDSPSAYEYMDEEEVEIMEELLKQNPMDEEKIVEAAETFVGSFAGCRFLRYFNYEGPDVTSLGRLKQLERLRLSDVGTYTPNIPAILENLSQLRSLSLVRNSFSRSFWSILQPFSALEEIELKPHFPAGTAEELVKLPLLKSLIISSHEKFDFSPIWGEFKSLERLVLKGSIENSNHLPEIRSLKEVEIFLHNRPSKPWQIIQKLLSFNPQVNSLIVHFGHVDYLDQPENLLQMAQFLEIHQNIKSLQVLELGYSYDNSVIKSIGEYSRFATDRFVFRSPEHRQEYVESLRRLAEAKRGEEPEKPVAETRNVKRPRLQKTKGVGK